MHEKKPEISKSAKKWKLNALKNKILSLEREIKIVGKKPAKDHKRVMMQSVF